MSDGGIESTRARILSAAALEIRQIGPRRMSVSGVATRLGMSHANVYHYFASKAALVEAVLNVWLRTVEVRLQDIVDGPDPADDKLERFLTTLARAYAEGQKADGAIFRLLAEPGVAVREAERHLRRVEGWLERIAEEGISTRLFHLSEVRRAAQLAGDLAASYCDPRMVLVRGGDVVSEQRRDRAIRAAVRALVGR
ncbi:MAG: TetR/AcrR family transcriptional regulator [Proteobacteria bacterium]|nr:TetR/AcrR family transcriptional regulator [Pseudomonadota bacterium]